MEQGPSKFPYPSFQEVSTLHRPPSVFDAVPLVSKTRFQRHRIEDGQCCHSRSLASRRLALTPPTQAWALLSFMESTRLPVPGARIRLTAVSIARSQNSKRDRALRLNFTTAQAFSSQ